MICGTLTSRLADVTCVACGGSFHRACVSLPARSFANMSAHGCICCYLGPELLQTQSAAIAGRAFDALRAQAERTVDGTIDNQRSKLRMFVRWCQAELGVDEQDVLPVGNERGIPIPYMIQWLIARAKGEPSACPQGANQLSTFRNDISALSVYHRAQGFSDDRNPANGLTVQLIMPRLRRQHAEEGRATVTRKTPFIEAWGRWGHQAWQLAHQVGHMAEWLYLQNTCIIDYGFYGIMRGKELASIRIEDARFHAHGVDIMLRTSKTSMDANVEVYFPERTKSGAALKSNLQRLTHLLAAHGITEGPLFRRPSTRDSAAAPTGEAIDTAFVATVVRDCLERATQWDTGMYEAIATSAAHSLRRGGATHAMRQGYDKAEIKLMGRWKSDAVDLYMQREPADIRAMRARM